MRMLGGLRRAGEQRKLGIVATVKFENRCLVSGYLTPKKYLLLVRL